MRRIYCKCGCGKLVTLGRTYVQGTHSPKWKHKFTGKNHWNYNPNIDHDRHICVCGCGGLTTVGHQYIHGHYFRGKVSGAKGKHINVGENSGMWNPNKDHTRHQCACGCGGLANVGCKYILGHHRIGKHFIPSRHWKLTDEQRRSHIGNKNGTGSGKALLGRPKKQESIDKMKATKKRRFGNPLEVEKVLRNIGNPCTTKINKLEKRMSYLLRHLCPGQYKYNGNYRLGIMLDRMIPDFVDVNGNKKCIEVYCDYWKKNSHGSIENYQKIRTKRLNKLGWKVLYVEDNEFRHLEQLKDKISSFV